jgi:glucosamine-6-phosphate deaminase
MAADLIGAVLRRKPSAVIGLPTGQTPLGAYRRLAAVRPELRTSRLRVVSLDEYLGVGPQDRISLFGWLHRAVLGPLHIADERVLRLPGDGPEPQLACAGFDRRLQRLGGFDLLVLGLGWNGHVAFNEPGSPPAAPTRIVALQPGTVRRNLGYWRGRPVPTFGVTIGMRQILRARRIFLLVSGPSKARILAAALNGPLTPAVPASLLRLGRLTVLADSAAAKGLRRAAFAQS